MSKLQHFLKTVSLELHRGLPAEVNRKGWIIVRLDPIDDDLTLVTDALLEEWEQNSRLLVVLDHTLEEELMDDQLVPLNDLKDKLDECNIRWFRSEEALDDYIDEVHMPEDGEV